MSEWKEYKLGDLTIDGKGSYGIAAPAVDYDFQKYTYLRITDINDDGTLNKNGLKSVDNVNAPNYLLQPNDIVFARTGASVGRSYFYDERDGELVYAGFLIKYSLDPSKVNPKLIKFYTHSQTYYDWIQTVDNGATRGNINAQTYASMPILLPEREVQDKIVSILGSLDDKIDLLNRENATLEAMAETLFRQWFIEKAKDDWKEVLITELFEVKDGTHDTPKPQSFGHKLITSKYIHDNSIDFNGAYNISDIDFYNINKRSKVEENDILFSMIGTIGLIYLEQNEKVDYAIKNVGLIKTSQNPQWKYYVYLWFKSELGFEWIHENKTGSTQEYISLNSLRNIKYKIRDYKQIQDFNQIVNDYFTKFKTNQQQIQTLIYTRDGLLSKLMSNEINV